MTHDGAQLMDDPAGLTGAGRTGRQFRKGRKLRRLLIGTAIATVSLWLGWNVVSIEMARRHLPDAPATALWWRPDDPAALVARADVDIEAGHLAEARLSALAALQNNPLSLSALALLVDLATWNGDQDQADRLLALAASRSFHADAIQAKYIGHLVSVGQFADALRHMDGSLRARSIYASDLVNTGIALGGVEAFRTPLLELLSRTPPWRATFMSRLGETGDPETVNLILDGLASTPSPATARELSVYIKRLLGDGDATAARAVWMRHAAHPDGDALLTNRSFELDPDGSVFDWRFGRIANTDIRIVPRPDGASGRALVIAFAGGRIPFQHVSQLLVLSPGRYELRGLVRTDNLRAELGLIWQISCDGKTNRLLGKTAGMKGTMPWTPFSVGFTVPDTACDTQLLRLSLDAPTVLDREVEGRIWFDDLSITRGPTPEGE